MLRYSLLALVAMPLSWLGAGAALAQTFSLVLPRWEFNEAPRLASRLQAQIVDFAKVALSRSAGDQEYRLARKSMIEAIAALSDSAGRMGGEPQAMHRGLDEMTKMLIAAYRLCANISALRSGFRARNHDEKDRTTPELLTGARDLLVKALGDGPDMTTPAGSALASQPSGDVTRWELANLALATDAFVAAASTYRRASKQR